MIRNSKLGSMIKNGELSRGQIWGMLIIGALVAFELFNFSTTDFALTDLLGDLRFAGLRWATILAIAFCGIDFAGIARLFTPEQGENDPAEVWYLFGAWMLAATMNAVLTWWGVSIAIANHTSLGSAVIPRETILSVAPVFVAVMVWLIRVLIIGTFSVAGDRLFSQDNRPVKPRTYANSTRQPARTLTRHTRQSPAASFRPAPKGETLNEPTYHSVAMKSNQSELRAYRD